MNKSLLGLAIAICLGFAANAQAADVVLQNVDAPGVGLNDLTAASPVGNNLGKTRGEQARIAYQYAADMWGGILESNQKIYVQASFAPLTCTATGGVLASAGATLVFTATLPSGPRAFGVALGDAMLGFNLTPYVYGSQYEQYPDIVSRFNGAMGSPGCLEGQSWYFGLDGKTPEGQVNFLNVVMHEIGHGLGVQGFINRNTLSASFGANSYGAIDVYTANAYDNAVNKPYSAMTDAERRTALLTPGRTVWTGSNVNYNAALTLNKRNALSVTAPAAIAGKNYEIGYASFGALALPPAFAGKEFVLINDGNGTSLTDGCGANGAATTAGDTLVYANAAAVAGKIAVIDRGTCSFEYKSKIAQDNGAVGVIIANTAGGVIDMGRALVQTSGLTIPTVMISQADGIELKANIAGARASVAVSPYLAGADNSGRTRLYTPSAFAAGSSFSHFDTALAADALMEPFDSPTVQAHVNVDLTPGLFADIGWKLNPGNAKIGTCDTGVDAVANGGIVLGANVKAHYAMCKALYPGNKLLYTKCMTDHGTRLRSSGFISSTQHMKVVQCTSLN